jgi:hypothetical protein
MDENVGKQIEALLKKASESHDSSDAQRFTQAACNAANALITYKNARAILT